MIKVTRVIVFLLTNYVLNPIHKSWLVNCVEDVAKGFPFRSPQSKYEFTFQFSAFTSLSSIAWDWSIHMYIATISSISISRTVEITIE
jgi:hypothetical protein